MQQRFYNIADTLIKNRGSVLFCSVALMFALAGCAAHAATLGQTDEAEVKAVLVAAQGQIDEVDVKDEMPVHFIGDSNIQQQEIFVAPIAESQVEFKAINEQIGWSEDMYSGGEMAWPVPEFYFIKARYGLRNENSDFHTGMDIGGEEIYGAAVIAASDGIVKFVSDEWESDAGYGMYIILDHGGETTTLYAHCSRILVYEGDSVVKGQEIAEVGATGYASKPHLHFEVRIAGKHENPIPYMLDE